MSSTVTAPEDADASSKNNENSRKRPPPEDSDAPKDGPTGADAAGSSKQEGDGNSRGTKWKKTKSKEGNERSFAKKGAGKWIKDFGDGSRNTREDPPHVGSFANPAMREQFGVVLDDANDVEETNVEGEENKQPTNKRKVVLFLGFLGTKYGGFQMNPEQRTLQAEVELALYRAGMITKSNFGTPHKYSWSNSARTDKGVHACAQVCSVKLEMPETDWENKSSPANDRLDGPRKRLEAHLPSDIRVLDIVRTTRNFCAKTQRERVRYQYMIPSFLLHPDWKGIMEEQGIDTTKGRSDRKKFNTKMPLTTEEAEKLYAVLREYRSTEENRNLLQAALQKYEGTQFFHNFTKGLKPGQAQARRFIETFKAQDPVVVDGVEWIPTQVLGQSFLLHQIRKMICVAIDIARGAAPLEFMDKALDKKGSIPLHVAPAQGLFLEMSYFGGYNRRKGTQSNHDLSDIDWTKDGPAKERWSAFRDAVRSHICQEDKNQLNFVQFLFL
jgi:tRNA pseudouridine38-40 synthase